MPKKGYKQSPEHKAQTIKNLKKEWTDEDKKRMSKIAKAKGFGKWMVGKIGANKGKKFSKKWRENLRKAHLGQVSWCLGKKLPERCGINHHNWKGDNASKVALHLWVYRHKGKPKKCSRCGVKRGDKIIDYMNINHKYHRNLNDYIPMCRRCHRKYDIENNNYSIGFMKSK